SASAGPGTPPAGFARPLLAQAKYGHAETAAGSPWPAGCRVQSAMYFAFAAPARAGPRLSLGSAAAPTGWGHTAAAPLPPAASPVARRVFGLGTSEILVILAIGALVLGPDALKNVAKEAGKAASDLKDVPDAFQDRGNEPGQEA
ncbi:unnamed protein product, partial [Prorocentrum cordatum]